MFTQAKENVIIS